MRSEGEPGAASLVKDLLELSAADVALAGGKGAALGEMARGGFPVPPGFVLLSPAFDLFMRESALLPRIEAALSSINPGSLPEIARVAGDIHRMVLEAQMPGEIGAQVLGRSPRLGAPFMAVRSSATAEDSRAASWAGQFETYLGTPAEQLVSNVQKCWASLYSPSAVSYMLQTGATGRAKMAVVVQAMVAGDVSGVAFSAHPVTGDRNTLIIEAVLGLGEGLVGGHLTPDTYIVRKHPPLVISIDVSAQDKALMGTGVSTPGWHGMPPDKGSSQKLADHQILALAEMVTRVEEHWGFPVDVEWALEAGRLYLLQSRPITTLVERA